MTQTELVGKVQTVVGPISPGSLGITSPHEHLLIDMSAWFSEPVDASQKKLAHETIRLDNLWWVRSHSHSNIDNLRITDESLAIKEVLQFKSVGGKTIVELSNFGLGRNPLGLVRISRATGLKIIMGTGYYIGASHAEDLAEKTEEQMADLMTSEILIGVDNTNVHAGIIGEIGCSIPLSETERKVLRASAIAQRRTGAAINIHPSPSDELALEIVGILKEAGADLTRTVISHVDLWSFHPTTCRKLADTGCYIEYDRFSTTAEIYPPFYVQGRHFEPLSDTQKINDIIFLINEGYIEHILIAHDICLKYHLTTYGGCGYAHILRDVVPVMKAKGITSEQIHTLLVENPKRMLQFVPALD